MPRQYVEGDEPVPGLRLIELLGEGGFGTVWKAGRPGKTEVAVKIIRLDRTQGRKEFRALQRVKRIRHVNLVPINAFWVKDDAGNLIDDAAAAGDVPPIAETPTTQFGPALNLPHDPADGLPPISQTPAAEFARTAVPSVHAGGPVADELIIEMGLCDRTLSDRLRECRSEGMAGIPVAELLPYMHDAARAIDYLSSGPFALQHCDIKPQNIMIVGGAVQVCDFGLAQFVGAARTSATNAGTIAYAAPECMRDGEPSRSTDQYSLAISYYELRTGTLPYRSETIVAVTAAVLNGDLDFSRVPPAEQAVLRRATSGDPSKRYPTASAMVAALGEAIRETSPRPTPTPTPAKMKWPWAVAAVAAAGVMAGVALWPDPVEPPPIPRPVKPPPIVEDNSVTRTEPLIEPEPEMGPNAEPNTGGETGSAQLGTETKSDPRTPLERAKELLDGGQDAQLREAVELLTGDLVKQEINAGRVEEVKSLLVQAVERHAEHPLLFGRLGAVHWLLGDFENAAKAFTEALRLDDTDADRSVDLVNRGRAYQSLGRDSDAMADFREAAKLDPGNCDAHYLLAECYRLQAEKTGAAADYAQAVAAYSKAIDDPQREHRLYDLSPAYFWRGICQLGLKKWSEAGQDFDAAIEQPAGPNGVRVEAKEVAAAYCLLAEGHFGQNEIDKAVEWLKKAIELAPDDATRTEYQSRLKQYESNLPHKP